MQLNTNLQDMREVMKKLGEHERKAGRVLPPGNIERICREFHRLWGIPLTEENIKAGIEVYYKEWEESAEGNLKVVAKAGKRAGLGDANSLMNSRIAALLVEEIKKRIGRINKLNILDIGAGGGGTSYALLKELKKADLMRMINRVILLDVDGKALEAAEQRLLEIVKDIEIIKVVGDMHEILSQKESQEESQKDNKQIKQIKESNIIIANASLHHTPVYDKILRRIAGILSRHELAFFGLGEWTHGLWATPVFAYLFFEGAVKVMEGKSSPESEANNLGEELRKLRNNLAFIKYLEQKGDIGKLILQMLENEAEINAMVKIATFWYEVIESANKQGIVSPIWLYEGHIPHLLLQKILKQIGGNLTMQTLRKEDTLNTIAVVVFEKGQNTN